MRKLMLGTALSAFITLGGCTTNGTQPAGGITIQDVQNAAVAACSFLPTAASIASLLTANPAVATASQVAALICEAVTAKPPASAKLRGPNAITVVVNGKTVKIEGEFVAGK